jgi:peptidoglycan/LPS O-acetylase OafA/YrhL
MPGLDGLRALAVFAVIAYHLNLPFVPGGFLGVTLFFVLSGYLITDLLLSEWRLKGRIEFRSFFIRRAKRLLPSVFVLLICLSGYVTVFQPELLTTLKSEFLSSALFFSNWWYIFTDVPYFGSYATPRLLTHLWSLAVEAQFYIIWPFLLFLGRRYIQKKWIQIAVTAAVTVFSALLMAALFRPGADPSRVYYGTDTRAFSLLLGALLAFVFPSSKLSQPEQKRRTLILADIVGFIALASILFMSYYITQYDDFLYFGGMFVFSAASALLIGAAANPYTVVGKVFSWKPLRFLGTISYGIYLWHFPIIALTNALVPSTRINVVLCVFQIAASILLASASYYLIENPMRRNKILESLKSKTCKDFFSKCLRAHWRIKTAATLAVVLILISGVGFFLPQAAPISAEEELSALPSSLIIAPAGDSVPPEEPGISNPIPEPSPLPSSEIGGTAVPADSSARRIRVRRLTHRYPPSRQAPIRGSRQVQKRRSRSCPTARKPTL